MREIRFRAWDKVKGETILWNRLLNWYNLRNVFMRPEMCGLILMQFTGRKDKNGVEIFEKDIVKISVDDAFDYVDGIGFVDWYEKKSEYAIFSKGEPWIPLSIKGEIEVIGNIYENPELLD